ncbi:hypothetical protein EWM64_g5474, partial [Hericium alpestre]
MDSDTGPETHFVHNLRTPDPFAPQRRLWPTLVNALLATALFRCWHILLFFAAWSTLGTVLGFVISYRTTSSFERYNEGRRYWSQIVLSSRTFARLVWFHVPDTMAIGSNSMPADEKKARIIVEKKTVLNLLEAFGVAVKHYLRGEEGIYYVDLYHLVKFLPAYSLPAGIPSMVDLASQDLPSSDGPQSPTMPSRQRRPSNTSRATRSSSISYMNLRA